MKREPVDPCYKYVDGKIKPIKEELAQLKVAHDAVATEQTEQKTAILRTQLFLADFMVSSAAQSYRNLIDQSRDMGVSIDISKVVNQLVADTTRAKTEIRTSKAPLLIAAKFTTKWENNLEGWGFPATRI